MTEIVIRMLQEMRAEIGGVRTDMREGFARIDARFNQIDARFERVDARFEVIERTLLGLAEQNGFIVKHLKSQSRRQSDVERRVDRLEHDEKP